ncbi:hypothetical protein [Geodermatophilus sp. URMC 64]
MILAAGLLVLLGVGLFVAGLATGTTVLYWATVAVCAAAAVLLVLSRRGLSAEPAQGRRPADLASDAAVARSTRETPAAPTGRDADGEVGATAEPAPVERAPAAPPHAPATEEKGEPPVEDVEVTDLLLVVDLKDEVFVVDEHPRYHLADCRRLAGQTAIPLPIDEARADGFTPCGVCSPDRTTAERERARRKA